MANTPSRAKAANDYRKLFPNTNNNHQAARDHSPTPLSSSSLGHHHLIPPNSSIARKVLMGNAISEDDGARVEARTVATRNEALGENEQQQQKHQQNQSRQQPKSNLSALLEEGNHRIELPNTSTNAGTTTAVAEATPCSCEQQPLAAEGALNATLSSSTDTHDEADSASGPPPPHRPMPLGHSAPTIISRRFSGPNIGTPPTSLHKCNCTPSSSSSSPDTRKRSSSGIEDPVVRRCISSKELETLAPPSGSPYGEMLNRREELEHKMTERLREKRDNIAIEATPSTSPLSETAPIHSLSNKRTSDKDVSSSSSSQKSTRKSRTNEDRNRRRAAHNRAVVDDLCEVVTDLFVAESKLINPTMYGVSRSLEQDHVLKSVQKFVAALPTRYALGADTPSEVLLHMRLMAVARSDPTKCVVHIINLDDNSYWTDKDIQGKNGNHRNLRLVTISCSDALGLLEYITKILGTGGSRVLDADVMLSSDRAVLDRFVVETNGRLRLDKLAQLIEAFLKQAQDKAEHDREHKEDCSCQDGSQGTQSIGASGPLYFSLKHHSTNNLVRRDIEEEMQTAVPLAQVLASPGQNGPGLDPSFETLKRHFSMPNELACRSLRGQHASVNRLYTPNLSNSHPSQPMMKLSREPGSSQGVHHLQPRPDHEASSAAIDPTASDLAVEGGNSPSMRHKRPLVNRRGASDLDAIGIEGESVDINFVTVPSRDGGGNPVGPRVVPLIPFDELKLIETVGMGRVSTIYRTAWQSSIGVEMVALKVAMANPETRDMSHVDELRREADIAARLKHPNVVDLVGVAADAECFCLAYDFCEGGSVLSLLSDTSRYYEYLPIALDVANGMAYLHSRDIIHRDLKPSNVLLTRDHRAKIADFGMSVANAGQELTAETGTYRFMAPEVIRHESYSSNADVYSFGVFLWQLITRQVPFASMTPVQAAYAVAEGRRPEVPASTPLRLKEIIEACWDQDSHKRPSFTYIAMTLADYAKISFSPASVGAQTLQIANDMLATVEGNSNINVDFTAPVPDSMYLNDGADVGLEI